MSTARPPEGARTAGLRAEGTPLSTAPSHETIAQAVREALPQARAAWLFGSAAKGAFRDGSDIDLAVDLPQPLSGAEKWRVSELLALRLGTDVDLLDFLRLHTVMQFQVLSTGQLLFSLDPVRTHHYTGFVFTEYQNIQSWRQPMMAQLAERLATSGQLA